MYAAFNCKEDRSRRQSRVRGRTAALNAYLSAAITLSTGAFISVKTGDWTWFSRCGSLVVVIGILLTSSQVIDHMERLKQRYTAGESEFQRDWAIENKQQSLLDARLNEEVTWMNEKSGFYMLIMGTLIWGFGDLPGLL